MNSDNLPHSKRGKRKILLTTLVIFLILIGLAIFWLWVIGFREGDMKFGVTYSPRYAKELGLDSHEVFLKMLDDLEVKKMRFPIYWDEVETSPGQYNFSEVEWYLEKAREHGVEVIASVGAKQPRWPECFVPTWASSLNQNEFSSELDDYISKTVSTLKKYDNIVAWQVENEPSLKFGGCESIGFDQLKKEVDIVRSLDNRDIIITESGELSNWIEAMGIADRVGVSLYRQVWSPWFGRVSYPFPPSFYPIKAGISDWLSGKKANVFISELQTEPWGTKERALKDIPVDEQKDLFSAQDLKGNVAYAKKTGFKTAYLWGVEWWYYMLKHGYGDYWQSAKEIFH